MFVSTTCEGEQCWCGKPAARKVGEEIPFNDPNKMRHNLTSYICAFHFAQLMGPVGASHVNVQLQSHSEKVPPDELDVMRQLAWQCEKDGRAEIDRRVSILLAAALNPLSDKLAKAVEEVNNLGPVALFDNTVYHRLVKILEAYKANQGHGEIRIVPRRPTDREISEILYNINRKRSAEQELTEFDVREVIDNYFYNVGPSHPQPIEPET